MGVINFSGIASGIDSNSLISALLDERRATQIKPLQTKVQNLTDTNVAFDKLADLVKTLGKAADVFRDVNGTVLAKTARSSSESRVVATAANSASNGSYTVTVSALAKNANFSFDDRYATGSDVINSNINNGALAADRTVTVQTGTGSEQESVQVELTNTTTLSDFVNQFNSQSTKAEASVVNLGTAASPSYAITISSINEGTSKGTVAVSVGSEITSAGGGAFTGQTVSQAADAQFSISGIAGTLTRSTNSINDVIPGLTLDLQSTGSATITVSDDGATTSSSIQNYVDAFNDVVDFVREADLVTGSSDGTEALFGPLAGSSIDENILSSLRSAISGSGISGGQVNTFSELGVTTQRDGKLAFDSSVFRSAVSKDPESVRSIARNLGDTVGGVSGLVSKFTQFGGIISTAEQANTNAIDLTNKRIGDLEKSLSQQEEALKAQYARLESLVGKLNSQQSALAGLPR